MTLLAIVAIHTAANEPPKVRQVMNKIHRNVATAYCATGRRRFRSGSASSDEMSSRARRSARAMPALHALHGFKTLKEYGMFRLSS